MYIIQILILCFFFFLFVLYCTELNTPANQIKKKKLLSHILLEEKNRLKEIKGPFISSLPNAINNNFCCSSVAPSMKIKKEIERKRIFGISWTNFLFLTVYFLFFSIVSCIYMLLQCLARLQNFQLFLSFIFIGKFIVDAIHVHIMYNLF